MVVWWVLFLLQQLDLMLVNIVDWEPSEKELGFFGVLSQTNENHPVFHIQIISTQILKQLQKILCVSQENQVLVNLTISKI